MQNSIAQNKTVELWSSFMPRKRELESISSDLFAIQSYSKGHFQKSFDPHSEFTIMAMIEVLAGHVLPNGMKSLIIPKGSYAVFNYKGKAADFAQMAMAIYGKVIPESKHQIAERPHFQIMGPKYFGPDNPASEEEIWVPVD